MLLAIAMLASGFASEVFAWALVIMQGHGRGRGAERGGLGKWSPLCVSVNCAAFCILCLYVCIV